MQQPLQDISDKRASDDNAANRPSPPTETKQESAQMLPFANCAFNYIYINNVNYVHM